VFWEAMVMTIAIFLVGLFLGMMIEQSNSNKISSFLIESEISLADGNAFSEIIKNQNFSCDIIKNMNIEFADKVYEEAKLLEQFDGSEKLTDNLKSLHKKYDLLRTLLWTSNQESLERCKNYNLIIYLYEYETEELDKKAQQNVWSKIISDLHNNEESVLLIPIAADSELSSLNLLLSEYDIKSYPVVIINNKNVLYEIESEESLKKYLD